MYRGVQVAAVDSRASAAGRLPVVGVHARFMQGLVRPPRGSHPSKARAHFGTSTAVSAMPSALIRCSGGCCSSQVKPAALTRRSPQKPARHPAQPPAASQRQSTQSQLPAVEWGTKARTAKPSRGNNGGSSGGDGGDGGEEGWGFLDVSRLDYAWPVPWGPGRVVGGMLLWLASFVGVGFVAVPVAYKMAGVSIFDLGPSDKAVFTLVCQLVETIVSLSIIRVLTAKALDEAPKEDSATFFNYSLSEPFSKPDGWLVWASIGVVLSPFVVGTVAGLLSLVGYEESVGGRGTVDGVAGMINLDLSSYLSLLSVTGLMAPILEETVFRGFLLTSLTKWTPTWVAVPASAFCFGLAHLSLRDFPVLFALGCLLGVLYVRSKNLMTPIIVHGAWNSTVLTILFYLASTGVDVEELISQINAS